MTLLKIGEVAKRIGRIPRTIKNWYKWAEENDKQELLPEVHRNQDLKGTWYFEEDEIPKLVTFVENIKYGEMADFNAKNWGKRGKEIIEKKISKEADELT